MARGGRLRGPPGVSPSRRSPPRCPHYDTLRAERLPAALLQGQRDFFGAHTYGRTDRSGTFHTHWSRPGRPETTA
ncbi:hypothetical protein ACRAWF_19815 [Streptomyces sp. L7]